MDPNKLARFRADPSKVRVSVRPIGEAFRVNVTSRTTGTVAQATDKYIEVAIHAALLDAESIGIKGIDLELRWAYEHPMRKT
jgi:hypothetical protein